VVLEHGIPELEAMVQAKTLSIYAAYAVATSLSPIEQRALVNQGAAVLARYSGRFKDRFKISPITPSDRPTLTRSRAPHAAQVRRQRIRELAAEGYNSAQIAADVSMAHESVRYILNKEKIECPGDQTTAGKKRHNATRILNSLILAYEGLCEDERLIDFETLDYSQCANWITSLAKSHKALGTLIRRLKQQQLNRSPHVESTIDTTNIEAPPGPAETHRDPSGVSHTATIHPFPGESDRKRA
jgi:hypothetical protein